MMGSMQALASEGGDPMRLAGVVRRAPVLMQALQVARFHDASDLTPERDRGVEEALSARAPHLPWEAKNQAGVHLWYPRRFGMEVAPLGSCADGVATFPEIATCVGIRLLPDDDIMVVAPHGLDDLFGCVCRHNPTRVSASFYEHRVAEKGWCERWPKLRCVAPRGERTVIW
jgi:hypothetical protein